LDARLTVHPRLAALATVHPRLAALADRRPARLPRDVVPTTFGASAVLVLLWAGERGTRIVLVRRAAHLRGNPGDIAFPGGAGDPGESPEQTAVREAIEEIALDASKITIVGRLDEAWSASRRVVTPVVAWYHGTPTFVAEPHEVAEVIALDLRELAQPGVQSDQRVVHDGVAFTDAVFTVGATRTGGSPRTSSTISWRGSTAGSATAFRSERASLPSSDRG
jgi:8-oxo-dGTP pyrophosphatase MutT (NUDIX family)